MRKPFAIALIITIVGSSLYIYREVQAVCDMPLSYRIGFLDERFGLSMDEARLAVADAESVWEQATGKNLFTYDTNGKLIINFVFDERQAFAQEEETFRQSLDASAGVNSAIGETYEVLVDRYERLEVDYQTKVTSYEKRLAAYNNQVEEYNQSGGAPQEAFRQLEIERDKLDTELETVNKMGQELNALVDKINSISEQGNQLIRSYNESVAQYNDTFTESREFTQGDYQNGQINIYKFSDMTELELVLVHELGHAISLGHVEAETAIMHHLLGAQAEPTRVTEADLDEFERVCGQTTRSFIERLLIRFGL